MNSAPHFYPRDAVAPALRLLRSRYAGKRDQLGAEGFIPRSRGLHLRPGLSVAREMQQARALTAAVRRWDTRSAAGVLLHRDGRLRVSSERVAERRQPRSFGRRQHTNANIPTCA